LQPGRELFLLVFGQNHSGLRRLNELKFKKNGHRAVRRGLAPLNAAARYATCIDMDSLNQRFPEGEMPIEVLPFVKAVNEALTRLDAGVAGHDDALNREIKRDVRRMRTVVDQLLLVARRSSNEHDDAPSIDLGEAVRSIAGNYLPIAIANGRRLELDAPTPPVIARIGRWELECVVGNLIDNALRAEPQGGCVSIRVGADREIEVIDHGEGVGPEDREQIFEPFWRKSDAPPGTGLGLAIVKEIMEMHGGRISVEETPYGGATFRMTFQ
jgi:signal transduction histidine kinase